MFENKIIEGIYYSRFVASWINATSRKGASKLAFKTWLRQLVINGRHLTEEEVRDLYNYATNGKMELEDNITHFLISVKGL